MLLILYRYKITTLQISGCLTKRVNVFFKTRVFERTSLYSLIMKITIAFGFVILVILSTTMVLSNSSNQEEDDEILNDLIVRERRDAEPRGGGRGGGSRSSYRSTRRSSSGSSYNNSGNVKIMNVYCLVFLALVATCIIWVR